jgi:hypothetical protein
MSQSNMVVKAQLPYVTLVASLSPGLALLSSASFSILHFTTLAAMFPAAVSSCVHGLLGGVVDHRGTDAWDLADDTNLLQRLYALNVLRLEGHEPDAQLWTVRGETAHS